jgi:hypothetical protein
VCSGSAGTPSRLSCVTIARHWAALPKHATTGATYAAVAASRPSAPPPAAESATSGPPAGVGAQNEATGGGHKEVDVAALAEAAAVVIRSLYAHRFLPTYDVRLLLLLPHPPPAGVGVKTVTGTDGGQETTRAGREVLGEADVRHSAGGTAIAFPGTSRCFSLSLSLSGCGVALTRATQLENVEGNWVLHCECPPDLREPGVLIDDSRLSEVTLSHQEARAPPLPPPPPKKKRVVVPDWCSWWR